MALFANVLTKDAIAETCNFIEFDHKYHNSKYR